MRSQVAGYALNGDIYCVDCTKDMTEADEFDRLQNDTHRDGGPVFRSSETETQWHCGRDKDCLNATTEHEYPHGHPVGQPIRVTVLDYLEEPWDDPAIHEETEDTFCFTLSGSNFKYQIEYETDADSLVLVERTNMGTTETSTYSELPDGIKNAARQIVEEGKQAGAPWA